MPESQERYSTGTHREERIISILVDPETKAVSYPKAIFEIDTVTRCIVNVEFAFIPFNGPISYFNLSGNESK